MPHQRRTCIEKGLLVRASCACKLGNKACLSVKGRKPHSRHYFPMTEASKSIFVRHNMFSMQFLMRRPLFVQSWPEWKKRFNLSNSRLHMIDYRLHACALMLMSRTYKTLITDNR